MSFINKLLVLAAALTAFAVAGPASAFASWSLEAVPEPENGGDLYSVSCPTANMCAAVGGYEDEAGISQVFTEVWDGSEWSLYELPQPGGTGGYYNVVEDISCSSASHCVAAGFYETEAGPYLPFTQTWNGTKWTSQELPSPAGATAVFLQGVSCSSSTACLAVGQSVDPVNGYRGIAEIWNGTKWTIQTLPASGGEYSVLFDASCTSASACTASGRYSTTSGPNETKAYVEKWNGSKWSVEATPSVAGNRWMEPTAVSCLSSGECTTVGYYGNGEPIWASSWGSFAQQFNGSKWTAQALPAPPGAHESRMMDVSCTSSSACTAAGLDFTAGSALAEVWDGSKWSVEAITMPESTVYSRARGISCLAAEDCIAVGAYSDGVSAHLLVAHQ